MPALDNIKNSIILTLDMVTVIHFDKLHTYRKNEKRSKYKLNYTEEYLLKY